MASTPEEVETDDRPDTGLRGRKKAKRRQYILQEAGRLFEQNGFDATTMAEIAKAVDISPPTVFNYFGSKENILSALLFEGTERQRILHLAKPRRTGVPFAEVLGDLLCEITENTFRIAGKRVWRYAESVNIRRTNTPFQRQFAQSDYELLRLIHAYLSDYDLVLRSGARPDFDFLAQLFYDRWTSRYLDLIKDDEMPLEHHFDLLRRDANDMTELLFDDHFANSSTLRAIGSTG